MLRNIFTGLTFITTLAVSPLSFAYKSERFTVTDNNGHDIRLLAPIAYACSPGSDSNAGYTGLCQGNAG